MIIKKKDIDIAQDFFTAQSVSKMEPYAIEMNTKHAALPLTMKALEKSGINGLIIDELMLGIVIIWYTVEKLTYKRIGIISEQDIMKNFKLFQSFIKYFNESDDDEKALINYFSHESDLADFTVKLLHKIYKDPAKIPKEILSVYFSIMKCFEDKLEYTRR